MKQNISKFLSTGLLVLFSVSSIIFYQSCKKKDPCSGITCQNGGACMNGTCSCPTGYVGNLCQDLATTTVTYQNNTFTTMNVYVAGSSTPTYTIAPNSSIVISGTWGTVLSSVAQTASYSSSNTQIGLLMSWSLNDTFPATGNITEPLDVDANYFFLEVQNNSTTGNILTNIATNTSNPGYTLSYSVDITPNGTTYGFGYYYAFSNTAIDITGSSYNPGTSGFFYPGFSYVYNQYYLAQCN